MADTLLTDAKRKVLGYLKRAGPATAAETATALRLTGAAVRQHLVALEERGLVEAVEQAPEGRGRPALTWSLTDVAEGIFPDRHADLAVDLVDATRRVFGEEGIRRIVEVRARDQFNLYRRTLPKAGASLKRRVTALARQRTAEGYVAEVVTERPGTYLLIEHHCPICEVARVCTGLCQAELDVFRRWLGGGVTIERIEHKLSDGKRCVYRITGGRARP